MFVDEASQILFERTVTSNILDKEFLKNIWEGVRQIMAEMNVFFRPLILVKEAPKVRVTRLLQKERKFVISSPNVYHCGFNTGCIVAKAANFADFSWPEAGKLIARNGELARPFGQFKISVGMTLWKKASFLATTSKKKDPTLCNERLSKFLHFTLDPLILKAKRVIHHFVYNDIGYVFNWDEYITIEKSLVCLECPKNRFFLV